VADRYNIIRPIVPRDFNKTIKTGGAPEGSKFKITFKKSKAGTLPAQFEGTKYFNTRAEAEAALKAKQTYIKEQRNLKKKPAKVVNPKDYADDVKTRIKGVGLEKISTTKKDNVITKTYKNRATGKITKKYFSKLIPGVEYATSADAAEANTKYRIKNPIKNAPPDLDTLDEQKATRYIKKQERAADIKTRGGYAHKSIFSGDPQMHKGHAGNIRGAQTITGDKVIYTPAKINQMMSGDEGTVSKNRFTDLDYKIDATEKEMDRIKNSNMPAAKKKIELAKLDNKMVEYSGKSDGYKVVRLSDGSEYGSSFKKLQSIDPFDDFPGMSEKEIGATVNKYKKMNVTKNTSPKDIEMIKKVGVYLENLKNVKKSAKLKNLTEIEGVTTADKAPIPEKSKMLNMFKNFGKAKTAIPAAIIGGMMATGNEAEAAITYNPTIGSIVKTGSDDVASQSNLLEWAADNPEPLTVAGAVGAAGMTKPGSALLKGLIKTLAAPAGIATTGMTVKENLDKGESLPEALADPMAGLGMMGIGAGKLLRMGTPVGAAMTAAGLGKDYYEFAQDEIEKMNQMSDYDRGIYNEMLMDDTNIDF
jgi:hypothetical protein